MNSLNTSSRGARLAGGILLLILLLAAAYLVVYQWKLEGYVYRYYIIRYQAIRVMAAIPALYFSGSALFGLAVQAWARRPIAAGVRRLCAVLCALLLLLYLLYWALSYAAVPLVAGLYPAFLFLSAHPALWGIPGLLCAVATFRGPC